MILDIDPTVDYAFKYVFGRESTTSILIDLLDPGTAKIHENGRGIDGPIGFLALLFAACGED
jgi:hypothetical protein